MGIFSQSRLGVCEQLPFLSWSVLLSHCNMLLMSVHFRHGPRRQQPLVCLSLGPQLYGNDILASILIFTPPLDILDVCLRCPITAIPCIPLAVLASEALLGTGLCNPTKPNWCWFHTLCFFFQLSCVIISVLPLLWSLDSLEWPQFSATHKHSTLQVLDGLSETSICHRSTLLCAEAPPLFDLCRTCPGPGRLYFHFAVFTLTTILAPGRRTPLTTPWGKRTHLSHFWVPARCMFRRAAERNNVARRNSHSLSHNTHCRGCFLLRPLPSLMLDHIPWNHNVIYTRPSQLNHLAGVIPLRDFILFFGS